MQQDLPSPLGADLGCRRVLCCCAVSKLTAHPGAMRVPLASGCACMYVGSGCVLLRVKCLVCECVLQRVCVRLGMPRGAMCRSFEGVLPSAVSVTRLQLSQHSAVRASRAHAAAALHVLLCLCLCVQVSGVMNC